MKRTKLIVGVAFVLMALLALLTSTVAAQTEPLEVTGTINALSLETQTITVQVGDELKVFPAPVDFDWASVALGQEVTVLYNVAADTGLITTVSILPAEEEQPPVLVEFTGVVTAFDPIAGTITLQVADQLVTLVVPVEFQFDYTLIEVGDELDVTANLFADETVEALTITVVEDDDDEDEGEDGEEGDGGIYCTSEEKQHPVAVAIAATYGVTYEEVMEWKCAGFGFGNIMLALQTTKFTDDEAGDILQMKKDQGGWGVLWHSLGIVTNPKHAEPPADDDVIEDPQEGETLPEDGDKDKKCNPNNPNKPCDPVDEGTQIETGEDGTVVTAPEEGQRTNPNGKVLPNKKSKKP